MSKILIVDDDRISRDLLTEVLAKEGYAVSTAGSAEEALERLASEPFPLILSDIRMLELSGLDLLRQSKRHHPSSVVVLMTGFGSMEGAIEALKEGAFDYISKPFQMDELKQLLARARKHAETQRQGTSFSGGPVDFSSQTLIGKSPKIVEVYKTLARAALSTANVLIGGEAGTGKALVARAIHQNSPRAKSPFVKANGEGEGQDWDSLFAQARGGTLLLDEVERLSAADQVRLKNLLESEGLVSLDVRVISTTRVPLDSLRESTSLRPDLHLRLSVISFELPPLRERIEDLPELVEAFIVKHARKNQKNVSHLSSSAMKLLSEAEWKGNIRELESMIEKAVALANVSVLEPEDFPMLSGSSDRGSASFVSGSLEEMEKGHILRVLQDVGFNKSKASERLGIDRATLYRKAKSYGIELKGSKT